MSYIGIHDAQFSIIITIFHCLYDVKDREQKIKNSYFHILLYEFNLEKKKPDQQVQQNAFVVCVVLYRRFRTSICIEDDDMNI